MKNNDTNIMEFLKIGDYKIAKDRMYLSSHEWVLDNQDGTYTMGISDYAQKMLKEISYVQFEDEGDEFDKEDIVCVVEALKATGDIYAPFDCELIANNEELEDDPEIVSDSPYEGGWLVKIKKMADDNDMISAEEYLKVIEAELNDF